MSEQTGGLVAGRALDAEIATALFGRRVRHRPDAWSPALAWDVEVAPGVWSTQLPHYSTEIAAAWLVVEAMRERGYACALGVNAFGDQYGCKFPDGIDMLGHSLFEAESKAGEFAVAGTMPHAIAVAALAAARTPARHTPKSAVPTPPSSAGGEVTP